MKKTVQTEIGGRPFIVSTGKMARQASGSALVQHGDTVVLVTVVAAKDPKEDAAFLPLTVEYQEKIYAAGRIPGNYFRREIGRPSEKETLTCRLIDRPIRPLFDKAYSYETQVIATVLSMDQDNEPDVLALVGASAALEISDLPFEGPIAGVRVGRINGEFVVNPTIEQMESSDIDLVVAGSETGINMVEAGAGFVPESDMLDAIFFGHKEMQPIIDMQKELKQAVGKTKRELPDITIDETLAEKVKQAAGDQIGQSLCIKEKMARKNALNSVKQEIKDSLSEMYPERTGEIKERFEDLVKQTSRDIVLKENQRIDGRGFDEIRQITCEAGLLPRTHGSALFTRGETQVVGALTLGSGLDEQRVETLSGDETRRFMLHYNFPPFSVGEVKRAGGPSRRDIGHGNLATKAVEKILPPPEEFEYTIRLVGEVLESNGSSSMATVCASSLALMDGGVPVKAPVSGIAMGLVTDGDNVAVLSDILGDEDHFGDMDFKVAGSKDGITALQMDIKVRELSREILEKALIQAKEGRLHILDRMMATIETSRSEISPFAPKIVRIEVKPDKVREIIGPAGKVIRAIQSETNTTIEIDDEGVVKIAAQNEEDSNAALARVKDIALDPEAGELYEGKVVKITDFGAFVNIKPNVDGLVHISELAGHRVKKVTDVVQEGDIIKVKVLDVSKDGKIKLSYKAANNQ
ncbi:MAG: polyribonucleotide nucleotidyltransferase [Desulfarculaceae bacterium]|nr:polyribonucleotide nucleotidyltransferase [Desulfarculaceae bacterium]